MDSNTGLYFFPLKEHQGSDELHFKKVILLHIEPSSATYAQVLGGFKLNRDSPSFEQKLIVRPKLVTHRLSPSIFKLPLPRRHAAFQFSTMEMEESFCFRFSWWRMHLMFLARLLTHSGFLTKMAALLTTQFPTDVLVWLCAHQNTSNFCSPHPAPSQGRKGGKKEPDSICCLFPFFWHAGIIFLIGKSAHNGVADSRGVCCLLGK